MKNNKGITLLSLIIYILVMLIAIATLSSLTEFIYGNLGQVNTESYSSEEFNKFNLNFIKDLKDSQDAIINANGNGTQIIMSNNTNYNYISSEHSIYRNKIKIAENINEFSAEKIIKNSKNVIKIRIGTGKNNTNYGKTINYVLKYW